jgi:hypothetical protein
MFKVCTPRRWAGWRNKKATEVGAEYSASPPLSAVFNPDLPLDALAGLPCDFPIRYGTTSHNMAAAYCLESTDQATLDKAWIPIFKISIRSEKVDTDLALEMRISTFSELSDPFRSSMYCLPR